MQSEKSKIYKDSQLWRFIYVWGYLNYDKRNDSDTENICRLGTSLVWGVTCFLGLAIAMAIGFWGVILFPIEMFLVSFSIELVDGYFWRALAVLTWAAGLGIWILTIVFSALYICVVIGTPISEARKRKAAIQRENGIITRVKKSKPVMGLAEFISTWYTSHKEKWCVDVELVDDTKDHNNA